MIEGKVEKIKSKILPHIGWNEVMIKKKSPLFVDFEENRDFYFVNSFHFNLKNKDFVISET